MALKIINELPYQKLWFTLEDYKNDFKSFGKPFLEVVPKKWQKEFSTVTEMYETIMLDLQFNVNMYFNSFFDHVNLEQIPINIQELIKYALYHSFASKLYGVLFANKNLKTSFGTNTGYSIAQELTRNTGSYLDVFTPEALRALNLANIRQLMNANNNDWEKTLMELGELNYDSIYTKQEIDELLEILRLDTETMIKTIANWVEEKLQNFTDKLPNDEDFIDNVAEKIRHEPNIPSDKQIDDSLNRMLEENYSLYPEDYLVDQEKEIIYINWKNGPAGESIKKVEVEKVSESTAKLKQTLTNEQLVESNEFTLPIPTDEQVTKSVNEMFEDNFELNSDDFIIDEQTKKISINWKTMIAKLKETK